jgi:hypothetical protein
MSELRGRPFQPGNTFGRGRPKGSRNKTTRKMQEMLDKYCEPITQKWISMAIKGDPVALRLCVERLFPARRDGYVQFSLAGTKTLADVAASSAKVLHGVSRGELTPMEGEIISGILEDRRRSLESVELEARLERLEQSVADQDEKEELNEKRSDPALEAVGDSARTGIDRPGSVGEGNAPDRGASTYDAGSE